MNEHFHAVVLLGFTIVLLGAYIALHGVLEEAYTDDIRPMVGNAVKLYGLREVARTGALELTVDGRTYAVGSKDPGPLGVNQIASVRGLLAGTTQAIGAYNRQLAEYLERTLGSFTLSRRNQGYSWAPLSAVAPVLATELDSEQHADGAEGADDDQDTETLGVFRIVVSSPRLSTLRELPRGEATAQRLLNALQGGMVYYASDVYPLPLPDDADGDDAAETYSRLTERAVSAAAEVCRGFGGLGEQLRGVFGLETAVGAASDDGGDSCSFVPLIAATGDYYLRSSPECGPAQSCVSRCGMGCFHAELENLVLGNPGFFWTMGRYRWLEVLLLAVLGVMVRRLLDFSLVYARLRRRIYQGNREPPTFWNPRESVKTLMYLLFTPPLALAVVWAFTATDLLAEDAVRLGDTVSHGIIVVAFLLGLFPNVAYDVLNRVVQGVFGDAGGADPAQRQGDIGVGRPQAERPERESGTDRRPRPDEDDVPRPPSFETLRVRVRELLTGPLR